MTAPLTEGVTPDGQSMSVKAITAEVKQYGGYVTLSDLLMLTAIDNNLVQATKLIASPGRPHPGHHHPRDYQRGHGGPVRGW